MILLFVLSGQKFSPHRDDLWTMSQEEIVAGDWTTDMIEEVPSGKIMFGLFQVILLT